MNKKIFNEFKKLIIFYMSQKIVLYTSKVFLKLYYNISILGYCCFNNKAQSSLERTKEYFCCQTIVYLMPKKPLTSLVIGK